MTYGTLPIHLGNYELSIKEMMCYLYLPIKMNDSIEVIIEPRLNPFQPLIDRVVSFLIDTKMFYNHYIYVTAKNLFVTPDNAGSRPGYHGDGFLTKDLNFIWCDKYPTIFNSSKFNITPDHEKSLGEFDKQALPENDYTFKPFDLLLIDQYVVHRTPTITTSGMRCFFKISVSKNRYNLINNSINHGIDYDWKMYDREEIRNDPSHAEKDSITNELK